MSGTERITYADYLRVHQLINLQDGGEEGAREISSDEHHFIIVHQVYELWFNRIIRELIDARDILGEAEVPEEAIPKMVATLARVAEIFRLMNQQWKVMTTLTPQGFLAFRDHLGTSSGFESFQMRELEIIIGLGISGRPGGMDPLAHFAKLAKEDEHGKIVYERLLKLSSQPSLKEVLGDWLARTPIHGSSVGDDGDEKVVNSYVSAHLDCMRSANSAAIERFAAVGQDSEAVRNRFAMSIKSAEEFLMPEGTVHRARAGLLFIESYRELPLLSWPRTLVDSVIALEEAILLFRTSHARMVERMIGRRVGSGGSSGVDYLDATTKMRVFTDLWAVRTMLVKRSILPEVESSEFYGFSNN